MCGGFRLTANDGAMKAARAPANQASVTFGCFAYSEASICQADRTFLRERVSAARHVMPLPIRKHRLFTRAYLNPHCEAR
ncbi:hypothetical protein DNX69_19475 [Rhodopseudomonas palustris]|uniref:Uncharacterized protein n=1 Tax=Rhodopseudomonas palustris TaxID=1076 RepID=A0A323UH68_RHOPL|nr:hypothetical protein DNX69_19475 [Rhodopseudomonas palustris]